MTPRIAAFLRESGVVPGITPATVIDAIKMNTTTFQGGSLVSLLFLDGSDRPAYVLRTPRIRNRPERIMANYRALQRMESVTEMAGTVPLPIFMGEVAGLALTIETCIHGTSLFAELGGDPREERLIRRVESVFNWLWKLHTALPADLPETFEQEVLSDLELILSLEVIGATPAEYVAESVDDVLKSGMRGAFCQGDFNSNNVLMNAEGDVSGVVDWEYSRNGAAIFDFLSMVRSVVPMTDFGSGSFGTSNVGASSGRRSLDAVVSSAFARYAPLDRREALLLVYVVRLLAGFVRATGNRRDPQLRPWIDYLNSRPNARRVYAQRRDLAKAI